MAGNTFVDTPVQYAFTELWAAQRTAYDARVLMDVPVSLNGRQVYFPSQHADWVPFAASVATYGGLTNTQLWEQYGKAVAGRLYDGPTEAIPGAVGTGFWLAEMPPPPAPSPPRPTATELVEQLQSLVNEWGTATPDRQAAIIVELQAIVHQLGSL